MNLLSATGRRGLALVTAICVALLLATWQGEAQTRDRNGKDTNKELSDRPFKLWLDELRAEACGKGISDATLDAALDNIMPVMRVIELDRSQLEFIQTFWTYLRRRVNNERIERGRALLIKHRYLLNKIQAKYGVPSLSHRIMGIGDELWRLSG